MMAYIPHVVAGRLELNSGNYRDSRLVRIGYMAKPPVTSRLQGEVDVKGSLPFTFKVNTKEQSATSFFYFLESMRFTPLEADTWARLMATGIIFNPGKNVDLYGLQGKVGLAYFPQQSLRLLAYGHAALLYTEAEDRQAGVEVRMQGISHSYGLRGGVAYIYSALEIGVEAGWMSLEGDLDVEVDDPNSDWDVKGSIHAQGLSYGAYIGLHF